VVVTVGNGFFLIGSILEIYALSQGVSTKVVGWSLIIYGATLLYTGYTT
jgi:hypothetical protein